MDHRPLDHPLEPGRRFRFVTAGPADVVQFVIDEIGQILVKLFQIDATGAQDGHRILVFGQRQQKVFQSRVFVVSFRGYRQSPMERLFQLA